MRMERILWGVIFLSGWFVLSTCVRQYHFVDEAKTWNEAQIYCREKYTDLATIESTEETNQLIDTVSGHSGEAWIGLYGEVRWRWSDNYGESGADYRNWETSVGEPDCYGGFQYCVLSNSGLWRDDSCYQIYPFICYNGTQMNPEFVAVDEMMSWSSAQAFCREHFVDLVNVRNNAENEEIKNIQAPLSWPKAWIGLFRDPIHYWSDGSSYDFSFWGDWSNLLGTSTDLCGIVALSSGEWKFVPCDMTLPFICYSIPIPVKRQVVKLKIKLGDGSVDLNDPAVNAGILTKLQDRMHKEAGSDVPLTWRQQPDGKVFHKEGKRVNVHSTCSYVDL